MLAGQPVKVPENFLGMNLVDYPVSGADPVGVITWKASRYGQDGRAFWYTIETAPGVYDFTNLDAILLHARKNGVEVCMTGYGCPAFYAQTTPHPSVSDAQTRGPWGGLGECSFPNLAGRRAYVQTCIRRYNLKGGAWYDLYGTTYGKGIQRWEPTNEPYYPDGNGNYTGVNQYGTTGFWWGTSTQLVDLCYTDYVAIKELDPSVQVSSPGFADIVQNGSAFFTGASSVNPAKLGRDCCDDVDAHIYGAPPLFQTFKEYVTGDIIFNAEFGLRLIKTQMKKWGVGDRKLYVGEFGVDSGYQGFSDTNRDWYAAPALFRYRWMAQLLMQMAAMGVQGVFPWHWQETSNTEGNSGNWQTDTNGVQKAWNDFGQKVLGKTIVSSPYELAGSVMTLRMSDGTVWSV